MFRILESTESKVAVPVGFLTVVGFFVVKFLGNPNVANILVPAFALCLGLAVGWVLGESFTYASGISKFILGVITSLFGLSVTLDQFRQRVSMTREKVFYLLSLIPITDPKIIDAILWFSLAFIVSFVFSFGINSTRRMEKT
jgi:ABC-type uncharacterized transport system permease subunit